SAQMKGRMCVGQDMYSPGGSLVRFQRKKLLILDLNGLLADITPIHRNSRDSRLAHAKVRGKYVFIRPYHDDFLRFCFQNFELGVWSSRMKVNVDDVVDILMKDLRRHLLFCWDASHCTTTKCSTLENQRKPLVLKELKKLWNKEDPDLPWEQGEFSPSNTLLVDDSPYKALCNPPHTAIFPQPYSYHNRTDNSLGQIHHFKIALLFYMCRIINAECCSVNRTRWRSSCVSREPCCCR
uniref:Mitochondrial import inner membrane translocase subunit TIM50 n=1 Tax=Aegilops tauschii subsp. strangulata TaxID=200361 RepID=A0A453BQ09_AEGTS